MQPKKMQNSKASTEVCQDADITACATNDSTSNVCDSVEAVALLNSTVHNANCNPETVQMPVHPQPGVPEGYPSNSEGSGSFHNKVLPSTLPQTNTSYIMTDMYATDKTLHSSGAPMSGITHGQTFQFEGSCTKFANHNTLNRDSLYDNSQALNAMCASDQVHQSALPQEYCVGNIHPAQSEISSNQLSNNVNSSSTKLGERMGTIHSSYDCGRSTLPNIENSSIHYTGPVVGNASHLGSIQHLINNVVVNEYTTRLNRNPHLNMQQIVNDAVSDVAIPAGSSTLKHDFMRNCDMRDIRSSTSKVLSSCKGKPTSVAKPIQKLSTDPICSSEDEMFNKFVEEQRHYEGFCQTVVLEGNEGFVNSIKDEPPECIVVEDSDDDDDKHLDAAINRMSSALTASNLTLDRQTNALPNDFMDALSQLYEERRDIYNRVANIDMVDANGQNVSTEDIIARPHENGQLFLNGNMTQQALASSRMQTSCPSGTDTSASVAQLPVSNSSAPTASQGENITCNVHNAIPYGLHDATSNGYRNIFELLATQPVISPQLSQPTANIAYSNISEANNLNQLQNFQSTFSKIDQEFLPDTPITFANPPKKTAKKKNLMPSHNVAMPGAVTASTFETVESSMNFWIRQYQKMQAQRWKETRAKELQDKLDVSAYAIMNTDRNNGQPSQSSQVRNMN